MASTVTLLELRTRARQEANMENSQFVTDSEMLYYMNSSAAELYDLLVQAYGNEYYVSSLTTSCTGNLDYINLPSDFYKLLGVDMYDGDKYYTLKRFNFNERNKFLNGVSFGVNTQYRIQGDQIKFIPTPTDNRACILWYIPKFTKMTLDSSTIDGINGWEEYVVIDCVIKMLEKEESDSTPFIMRKNDMLKRIQKLSEDRDVGSPLQTTDVTIERLDVFGFGGYGWFK